MSQHTRFHRRTLLARLAAGSLGIPALTALARASGATAGDALNLIPWPKSVERREGSLKLRAVARIVAADESLAPLTEVLAAEIEAVAGLKLAPAEGVPSRPGDVVLQLGPAMDEEQYRLTVTDRAHVAGGSYAGVAAGTVTLLQAISAQDGVVALPQMTVADAPCAAYRGLLVDPARHFHTPDMLRQVINLCRWYKIRFLQLHLTDDQSFTFPSKAYPKLATPGRHYTVEQLRALEQYAVERGVLMVPEFEMPGHAGIMTRQMPELFATQTGPGSTMNYARPEACKALDTIIGEMIDVFRAAPYFHIGADEVNFSGLDRDPDFQAAMAKTGVPSPQELYRAFIAERNNTVKRHGKQMIIWEGFRPGGKVDIPRDIVVMAFEGGFYHRPDDLVEAGYTIINTSWQPLYVVTRRPAPIGQWPTEHIFRWNMYRWEHFIDRAPAGREPIQLRAGSRVLGAQMCSWENPQEVVIPFVRERLAAMSERIWNPAAARFRRFFPEFAGNRCRADGSAAQRMTRER